MLHIACSCTAVWGILYCVRLLRNSCKVLAFFCNEALIQVESPRFGSSTLYIYQAMQVNLWLQRLLTGPMMFTFMLQYSGGNHKHELWPCSGVWGSLSMITVTTRKRRLAWVLHICIIKGTTPLGAFNLSLHEAQ